MKPRGGGEKYLTDLLEVIDGAKTSATGSVDTITGMCKNSSLVDAMLPTMNEYGREGLLFLRDSYEIFSGNQKAKSYSEVFNDYLSIKESDSWSGVQYERTVNISASAEKILMDDILKVKDRDKELKEKT